jgi:hypothetical protein
VDAHSLSGTARLENGRRQPFTIHLQSYRDRLLVRCVSPVGRLENGSDSDEVAALCRRVPAQVGVIERADDRGADLTVEEEVLLGDPKRDRARVSWLLCLRGDGTHVELELVGRQAHITPCPLDRACLPG